MNRRAFAILAALLAVAALAQTARSLNSLSTLRRDIHAYEVSLRMQHVVELAVLPPYEQKSLGNLQSEYDSLLRQLRESNYPVEEGLLNLSIADMTAARTLQTSITERLGELRGESLPRSWGRTSESLWLTAIFWLLFGLLQAYRSVSKRVSPTAASSDVPLSVTHVAMNAMEPKKGKSQTSVRGYTERVLQALSNLLFLAGPDGKIQMVNDAVCATLGYQRSELHGRSVSELIDSGEAKLKPGTQNTELSLRTNSGETVPVLLSASAVHSGEDQIEGLVIVAQDISERKSYETSLRAKEKRLRNLMERLVDAQEKERQKVARDLHDGMLQLVIAAEMHLTVFRKKQDPTGEYKGLQQGIECLTEAVGEGRRLIQNLRPPTLDKFGLAQSIRQEALKLSRELGCESQVHCDIGEMELSGSLENALYRIAQEALNNIRKYAEPTCISLTMQLIDRNLMLRVVDDGNGFDAQSSDFKSGIGLQSMRERAELLGGDFAFESKLGEGTSVEVVIPLGSEQA